jgi:hypothetical protein
MNNLPVICHETNDFAVVFKPPRMHCAPHGRDGKENETLLGWYANVFPPVMELSGRKEGDGGLLHRLDFETQGLVLFAKNRQAMENLLNQQKQGKFAKEYNAVCQKCEPQPGADPFEIETHDFHPPVIESYFRPYGPGRKQVRPVTKEKLKEKENDKDRGYNYKTKIIGVEKKQKDGMEFFLCYRANLFSARAVRPEIAFNYRRGEGVYFNLGGQGDTRQRFAFLTNSAVLFDKHSLFLLVEQIFKRLPVFCEKHQALCFKIKTVQKAPFSFFPARKLQNRRKALRVPVKEGFIFFSVLTQRSAVHARRLEHNGKVFSLMADNG